MMIPAGKMRHRVLIEDLETTQDTDGATVEDWVPLFDGRLVPAEIMPLSGAELIAAAGVQSKITTRLRLRFNASVRARMRVTHRGTTYNIQAVVPDTGSGIRFMTLHCESGVNDG